MPADAPRRRALPAVLFGLLAAVIVVLVWRGYGFYGVSLEQRLRHPDFQSLRAGGALGHGYGFAAVLLVLVNLLYLLRRRGMFVVGSMRAWLDVHVFTGLLAWVFAVAHSVMQLRTPIATLTAVSLALVVVSGIIGRLLHTLVPRSDAARVSATLQSLSAPLPALETQARAVLDSQPGPALAANASLWASLRALPAWLRAARDRRRALRVVVRNHRSEISRHLPDLAPTLDELPNLAAAELWSAGSLALLRSWRSVHRLFVILMLFATVVHIAVAWYYGYRWIFS